MNFTSRTVRFAAACFVFTLAACGGGDDDGGSGGTPAAGTVVGAAGGTVVGPNGAKVEIPPGALATDTTIRIDQTSAGAPALPGGFTASGQTYAFTPHGTTFAVPVTMTLPFDPALVPAGSRPTLYKTNGQNLWEQVASVSVGANTVSAQVTGFSFGTAGVERLPPQRQWSFFNDQTGETLPHNDFDRPPWQKVEDSLEFGTSVFDLDVEDNDKKITLEVFSSDDGVTFWASAEDQGFANLIQTQGFIKIAEPATLQFVITAATLQAVDFNVRVPSPNECPRGLELSVCHPLSALIEFSTEAYGSDSQLLRDQNGKPLLARSSSARLEGYVGVWDFYTQRDPMFAETLAEYAEAWSRVNFLFTTDAAGNPKAKLVNDIVIDVDLSSLTVGTKFYVQSYVHAAAFNERGRESAIAAYVRDPARTGGATVNSTGLQLTNDTAPPPPRAGLTTPVPCTAGPNPAAGVLQFSAANFKMLEEPFGGNRGVQITRTQGSTGAVSATLRTGGGTAVPGVHYTPKSITVNFADGDTAPRSVALEILVNSDIEDDRTVNVTLTEPGGCATLGAQASAVLTIFDDDRPAPPPPPSGLDPSFGNAGKVTLEGFGGDRSAMALQADGKIVMVGGTFTDFILARFNADGSVDRNFGIDGKVTTDMGSGFEQEEALAVAVQGDGKIVVVGHTAIDARPPAPQLPPTFAIARYNADGSLDASFGTGGRVSGSVNGIARAVAIQPDGKIVLAGDFELGLSNGTFVSDFTVARFNANGSLDMPFGTSGTGQVATDIGSIDNRASNIVLQPDGAIVVSGGVAKAISSAPTPEGHTDIVRYSANGTLDASFGSGGKITMPGALVGEGLALQRDGKLVLVGSVIVGSGVTQSTDFALMRLNSDGSADTTFGNAGTVVTAVSNERDGALAVALQADGKIVAAGHTSNINSNFAVARYNINGTLDTSFGNGSGILTVDFFRFTDSAESVLVQPDGKIVLGGVAEDNVDGYGLARINP